MQILTVAVLGVAETIDGGSGVTRQFVMRAAPLDEGDCPWRRVGRTVAAAPGGR